MNLIYVTFTLYTVIKTLSFSIYEIKRCNFKSFLVTLVLNILLTIVAILYFN